MDNVLITGGSGLIGSQLSLLLIKHGYGVKHLTRNPSSRSKFPSYKWDLEKGHIDPEALEDVDYIIHLAGENVSSGRWTDKRKKQILDSRVGGLSLLLKTLQNNRLKGLISASGISYYGTLNSDLIFTENDAAGKDFLASVSVDWENEAFSFSKIANRIVTLRTGIVLSTNGGALKKLVSPIRSGIGSALGTGKQYMPWIHIDDLCKMYLFALENEISGSFNAVSSQHTTNLEMTKAIAKQLDKKLWAPKVPAFALKLLFGDMATIILEGSRIDNKKIKEAGFKFAYDNLDIALGDLL